VTSTTKTCVALACLLMLTTSGDAQEKKGGRGRQAGTAETFLTDVPADGGNVLLGRPTNHSVTLSVLTRADVRATVTYGRAGTALASRTTAFELTAKQPRELVLDGLDSDTAYEYRVINAETGEVLLPKDGNGRFRTARAPGSPFTFTITADSHLDQNCSPELYRITLANALADKPDFHIDLGDTFMTGKHPNRESAAHQYDAQRYYFGLIGYTAPVFLAIGNHDGEEVKSPADMGADGLAVWSARQRQRFFPNPVPDGFYTGNENTQAHVGLLQDYYAWTWGDALFVVLDPYWTSRSTRGGKEPWNMTLGKAQYDWLAHTLRTSKAKWKFVFIHQLVGGLDRNGRGGAEAVALFEWGGHEPNGANTFATYRPGWEKPIHQLLRDTGVSIVFHGHDHFFARQERDGIIYQLVPQPGAPRANATSMAKDCGYVSGNIIRGSGYLRVTVTETKVTIDFMRTLSADGTSTRPTTAEPAYFYSVDGARKR
jgi:predicted phosphodiesterase